MLITKTTRDVIASLDPNAPADERLTTLINLGKQIRFEGNQIIEVLAATLASKEISQETLQTLPGSLQKEIEDLRKQIIPTESHGSVKIFIGHDDKITKTADFCRLRNVLFLLPR